MIQKTNKNILHRNKYIFENIFKFYILKYIIKFLQSRDNNKKKIRLLKFRNVENKGPFHRSIATFSANFIKP